MKKRIMALVMVLVVAMMAVVPAMAASGLNSNEEALLSEFEDAVDTKADLLGAEIVAQWKAEAANALAQVDLNASACADLSQGIKDATAAVADITTRRGLKDASAGVVALVNKVSQKYGMTVTVADNGFAKVTITTPSGTTIAGDTSKTVNQTGFGLLQTVVSVVALISLMVGALYVTRKNRLFA